MPVKSSQFWLQRAMDLTPLDKFHTQIPKLLAMDLSALSTRLSCARAVTSLPSRKSCRTSASRFPVLLLFYIDCTLMQRHGKIDKRFKVSCALLILH